ncbi:MAG TPA: hypothetical protein VGK67_31190 [Myxococcales bacterium]|jgi:sRNA-binding protein
MPKNANIDAAIRSIVADQVAAAMDPYHAVFDRVSAFMGQGVSRRGPGRPRKEGAPGRRATRVGAKDAAKAAKAFSVGDMVSYKQGRGTFEATVLEIDEATGLMKVQRLSDGKKVVRPASKVSAQAAGGAEAKPAKPAKQPKAAKAAKAKRAGKRGKAAKVAKIAFTEGQKVVYKQGRGSFDAKILEIDREAGTVKLERESDGKQVTRPAGKISAAA